MIRPAATPVRSRAVGGFSPQFVPLWQLALSLLIALYMLFIGGTFDAGLRYRVQLLNTLAAALLGLGWLILRSRPGGRVNMTGLEWPLGVFALSQWLALLTSTQPRLGLEWVASVTFWAIGLLLLIDSLRAGWPRAFVLNALLLLAGLIALQGLVEIALWYNGWLDLGRWPPTAFRLNGWLGHANLTAAFLVTLLPLALVGCVQAANLGRRAVLAALSAAMLVTLFFTSSRAGWLAAAFGLFVLLMLVVFRSGGRATLVAWPERWRRLDPRTRWLLAVAALLAAGALTVLLSAQSQHITHGPLFSSRETFWRVAWNMFQLQPLTGAGPDLFPWFYTRWVPSPPNWFAPHAHSLLMQILSGSGLLGLGALLAGAAAGTWQLFRRWAHASDPLHLSALIAGLAGLGLQHVFDYLLGSPFMVLVAVVVFALALTEIRASERGRTYRPWLLGAPMLVPFAVAVFALRGASLNDRGLMLAAAGDWPAAAAVFEQAATLDPGLTLYWQQAAYAHTRAGDLAAALPLWQRAAQDDPNWPLLPATAGVLSRNRDTLAGAQAQSQASDHLIALNLGVLAEADGEEAAATTAYTQVLDLRPASAAALFWQQSNLRQRVLSAWQVAQAGDPTPLDLALQALAADQAETAVELFRAALEVNPLDGEAHAGLAAAYLAWGDSESSRATWEAALRMPWAAPEQTLSLRLVAGDWARARGDEAGAAAAYSLVFSAINDYTHFGPGTYGHPQRSWYVFRRQALPADVVPEFARADITAAQDERFAWLAAWTAAHGDHATACFIAARAWREAAESESGAYWENNCQ